MKIENLYPLWIVPTVLLLGCGGDMQTLLSKDETRARAIEVLVEDPAMRADVVDRMLRDEPERTAMLDQIVENEPAAGVLIQRMTRDERGQAILASGIGSDKEVTRAVLRMVMLTGAAGEIIVQEQAERLGLDDALDRGNQLRSMKDLKHLGQIVDGWARANGGSYPICSDFEAVTGCLASRLHPDALVSSRLDDAWGRPFRYHSDDGTSYILMSYSSDGKFDGLGKAGPTSSPDADIVFSDGKFVQWPGHISRESVR